MDSFTMVYNDIFEKKDLSLQEAGLLLFITLQRECSKSNTTIGEYFNDTHRNTIGRHKKSLAKKGYIAAMGKEGKHALDTVVARSHVKRTKDLKCTDIVHSRLKIKSSGALKECTSAQDCFSGALKECTSALKASTNKKTIKQEELTNYSDTVLKFSDKINQFFDAYNKKFNKQDSPEFNNPTALKALNKQLKENSDNLYKALDMASKSNYLQGKADRKFNINIGWLVKNIPAILSGKYGDDSLQETSIFDLPDDEFEKKLKEIENRAKAYE